MTLKLCCVLKKRSVWSCYSHKKQLGTQRGNVWNQPVVIFKSIIYGAIVSSCDCSVLQLKDQTSSSPLVSSLFCSFSKTQKGMMRTRTTPPKRWWGWWGWTRLYNVNDVINTRPKTVKPDRTYLCATKGK